MVHVKSSLGFKAISRSNDEKFIGHSCTVPSCWSLQPLQCPVKPTCQLPALRIAFSDDFSLLDLDLGQTLIPLPEMDKEGYVFLMLPAQVRQICLQGACVSPCCSAALTSITWLAVSPVLSRISSFLITSSKKLSAPNLSLMLDLLDILKGIAFKEVSCQNTEPQTTLICVENLRKP